MSSAWRGWPAGRPKPARISWSSRTGHHRLSPLRPGGENLVPGTLRAGLGAAGGRNRPAEPGRGGGVRRGARSETGKSATNSAAILRGGRVVFRQSKMLLPTYDVFDEARWFVPAEAQSLCELDGRRIALTICEDAWNDKQFWDRRSTAGTPWTSWPTAGPSFWFRSTPLPTIWENAPCAGGFRRHGPPPRHAAWSM